MAMLAALIPIVPSPSMKAWTFAATLFSALTKAPAAPTPTSPATTAFESALTVAVIISVAIASIVSAPTASMLEFMT